MNVMQQTYEYIKDHLYDNEYKEFLDENCMLYIMNDYLPDHIKSAFLYDLKKGIIYNKIQSSLAVSEMIRINDILNTHGINAIFFKGVLLAQQLYNPIYIRSVGDIDLFVGDEYIDRAYDILINNGYSLLYNASFKNPHHIKLVRHGVLIELHRNIITPARNIKVNETYILSHTKKASLSGREFNTFDETATLLHLIYHLYMHTTLAYQEISIKEEFFVQNYNLFVKRRFYRIFEIALYAEKYGNVIRWNEFLDNVCQSNMFDSLIEIFYDINIIYPQVFPQMVVDEILKMKLDSVVPYDTFIEYYKYKYKHREVDAFVILRNIIDVAWESGITFKCPKQRTNNYYEVNEFESKKLNCQGTYVFQGLRPSSPNDISFRFSFWVDESSFHLHVYVKDDVVVLDNDGKHDYLKSDCLCVTIVTVGKSYRQYPIYFFLREEFGGLVAIPYDIVHSGKLLKDIILTDVVNRDEGYEVEISIPLNYIEYNCKIDDHFYMDIMVYDCDDRKNGTKTVLSLSSVKSERYNPIKYAKVFT